ncbi:hypothetical protein [Celeribacter ethanolicus]|uniref:Uncharacterized protein n=1 Tax=Celeribacter ethanolicus TaxID=1758178 RepID=A0A291GFJ7_9RHOB|nr:hypothetical protein [Celeribacter ethanolicus]ATG48975.1 hypothetical protein CEW89_16195 [Celeribacter ethanolicus]
MKIIEDAPRILVGIAVLLFVAQVMGVMVSSYASARTGALGSGYALINFLLSFAAATFQPALLIGLAAVVEALRRS